MGSIGANKGSIITYNIDTGSIDALPDYRAMQKTQMREAISDVQNAINTFMSDSWTEKDVDHLYEALADYFPRFMNGDEADKLVRVDTAYKIITTVDIRLHEYNGKIEVTLSPSSYYYDDFTDEELRNMGIERRR